MPYAKRNPLAWGEHDAVIREIATTSIDPQEYDICINPAQSKRCPVEVPDNERLVYPDIVVTYKDTDELYALYEIETQDSVNHNEAEDQWKVFGSLIDRFILVVPRESLDDTIQIALRHRVKIYKYGTYETDLDGNISSNSQHSTGSHLK